MKSKKKPNWFNIGDTVRIVSIPSPYYFLQGTIDEIDTLYDVPGDMYYKVKLNNMTGMWFHTIDLELVLNGIDRVLNEL